MHRASPHIGARFLRDPFDQVEHKRFRCIGHVSLSNRILANPQSEKWPPLGEPREGQSAVSGG